MNLKKDIRRAYREKRQNLTPVDMHARIAAMLEHFRELHLPIGSTVLSFQPMVEKKEIPIEFFEEEAKDVFSIRSFCYPAANFETGQMQAFLEDENLEWEEVGFGLTQPKHGTTVLPDEIDIVFVPLVAFDQSGNRIGYGKGFYDRYLKKCRPQTQKIGFSWFEAETLLPVIEGQDVPLNYCITPNRLYVF